MVWAVRGLIRGCEGASRRLLGGAIGASYGGLLGGAVGCLTDERQISGAAHGLLRPRADLVGPSELCLEIKRVSGVMLRVLRWCCAGDVPGPARVLRGRCAGLCGCCAAGGAGGNFTKERGNF